MKFTTTTDFQDALKYAMENMDFNKTGKQMLSFEYKGAKIQYPKPPAKTNSFGRQVFFDGQTGEQLKNKPKKELDQCFEVDNLVMSNGVYVSVNGYWNHTVGGKRYGKTM